MKKVYAVISLLSVLVLAWCTFKAPTIPQLSTGDIQEISGDIELIEETELIEMTWDIEEWNETIEEEITWTFDSGDVAMVEWSAAVVAGTVSEEVKSFIKNINILIKKRETQPTDEGKLTEEDIDLMEKIIEELKKL